MKNALLILAFVATSSISIPAQTTTPVMTNRTIQAMLSGGVPLPVITHSIKTAKQVDLYVNDREFQQLLNAGASKADADTIMKAINSREWNGVDKSSEDSAVKETTALPAKLSVSPAPVPVVAKSAAVPATANVSLPPVTPPAPMSSPVASVQPVAQTPPIPASSAPVVPPAPVAATIPTPATPTAPVHPMQVPAASPATSNAPSSPPVVSGKGSVKPGSAIYVDSNNGFDIFILAAFQEKKVPVTLVKSQDLADYVLDSSLFHSGGVIATSNFATTTRLSEAAFSLSSRSGQVVWAYAATKGSLLGRGGKQSVAEACAKHMKSDLF